MLRLLLALPVAVIMALALFTLMALMVAKKEGLPREPSRLAFNMVMMEQEQATSRRKRALPEPPELPEPLPQPDPVTPLPTMATPTQPLPQLNLDIAINGLSINQPEFDLPEVAAEQPEVTNAQPQPVATPNAVANQQVMPLYRVPPSYPSKAMRRGIEGYVVVTFTIDPQGRPTDIKVTEAEPKHIFNKEAIKALRRWKYQPRVVGGKAVTQPGQTVKLEFKLN